MTEFEKAREAIKVIFNAVPKGKFQVVIREAIALENAVGQMAKVLSGIRGYFIETTGEASPFVKKIDELVPRPAVKTE